MTARYIHHVTLTTGHSRRSFSSEIAAEALDVCKGLIERMRAAHLASVPLPGPLAGYTIRGETSAGRCLTAMIYAADEDDPIVVLGIAPKSLGGAQLWRDLHQYCDEWGLPYETDAEACPPVPWVAVAIDTAATKHMQVLPIVADFERCLAWAWMTHEH